MLNLFQLNFSSLFFISFHLFLKFLIAQIKDKIIEKAKKTGWKNIIERHKKLFVDMSENEVVETAKRYKDSHDLLFFLLVLVPVPIYMF